MRIAQAGHERSKQMSESNDEKQVRDVIKGYNEAYAAKDIDRVMSFFSENSKRIRPYAEGHIATGKDAVRATYADEFEVIADVSSTYEIAAPTISGDTASVIYTYRMSLADQRKNGAKTVATGKGNVKLRKTGGIWKITEVEETIDSWES